MSGELASVEEFHQAVGKAAADAALIDILLVSTLRVLVGCPTSAALVIFSSIDSFQTKKKILIGLAYAREIDVRDSVARLTEAAEIVYTKRNDIAHSAPVIRDGDSTLEALTPKRFKQPFKRITKASLEVIRQDIWAASHNTRVAYRELCKRLGEPEDAFFPKRVKDDLATDGRVGSEGAPDSD